MPLCPSALRRRPVSLPLALLVAALVGHGATQPCQAEAPTAAAEALRAALRRVADGQGRSAMLTLPDGTVATLRFSRVERRGPETATLIGTVVGDAGASALFVLHGDVVVGDMRGPRLGAFSLRAGRGGSVELTGAADSEPSLDECGAVAEVDGSPPEDTSGGIAVGPPCSGSGISIVDMLFVATPAAVQEAGGLEVVEADALLSTALTNLTLANSAIPARIRLVHTASLPYIESGNMAVDLVRLRGTSEGFLEEVHALRDLHGADLVCLRVATGQYCGIAFIAKDPPLAANGFSVVQCGGLVPAHEWGHSLGACHAPGDDNGTGACDVSGGAFPFSHGHRFKGPSGELFRTMMAYLPGTKILHYSSPRVAWLGQPTGVAGEADNATTITLLAPSVAAFRPSVFVDCDADGLEDLCVILDGLAPDCDGNWVPDACDLAQGTTVDSDGDGIPDPCDPAGDLDGDGDVDGTDLAIMLGSWGPCSRCPADLDGSGAVDGVDLGMLLATW